MGYDVNRFEGAVDEELVCPICSSILEDPVQVNQNLSLIFLVSLYEYHFYRYKGT
jgi:hypothetical protein